MNAVMNSGTTYTIKFDAKASSSKVIDVTLVDKTSGLTHWSKWSLNVSTTMTTYTYTFTPSSNLSNEKLEFRIGGNTADFTVDNVSISN
ncbi:Carbohydrate binding domain protein [compost metagenome]